MHIVLNLRHKLHLLPWDLRQDLFPKQENCMLQFELKEAIFPQFSLFAEKEVELKINKDALTSWWIPAPAVLSWYQRSWHSFIQRSALEELWMNLDISRNPSCPSEVSKPRQSANEIWPRVGGAVVILASVLTNPSCLQAFHSFLALLPVATREMKTDILPHCSRKGSSSFSLQTVAPQSHLWRYWKIHFRKKKYQ